MKVEMEDERTIRITPESTAEMIVLRSLAAGTVTIEKPKPFQTNVESLLIKV